MLRHHAGHVWGLRWHPADGSLLIGLTEGTQSFLARLDLGGKLTRLLPMHHSLIPYWRAVWSTDADGTAAAFLSEEGRPANEVWVGVLDGSNRRRLTSLNPHLDGIELGGVEVVQWASGLDGAQVEYTVGVKLGGTRYDQSYLYGDLIHSAIRLTEDPNNIRQSSQIRVPPGRVSRARSCRRWTARSCCWA